MKVADIIGKAIWYATLVALTVLVVTVVCGECGTLTTYRFIAPGLGGMVSNYDAEMLQATDAFYMLNGYVTETPGVIQRRTAIADYGVNVTSLYGAYGYYNPLTGDKLVIGVTDHATYNFGQFVVSDTFGTEVGADTLPGTIFPYADVYHDWTPYEDMLIHADGKSTPSIFTTTQGFKYSDSTPDTMGYEPHLISMGLEAPGQPRVNVLGSSGGLSGTYVYALAYKSGSDHGDLGIQSAPVYSEGKAVAITFFPHADSVVQIYRKRLDGKQSWYFLDTIYQTDDSHVVFIDTVSDSLSAGLGTIDTSIAIPGRFQPTGTPYGNSTEHDDSGQPIILVDTTAPFLDPDTVTYCLWPDSSYSVAYSFYDPVTGIESPLGPPSSGWLTYVDSNMYWDPDTLWIWGRKLDMGYIDTLQRPKWVRVYQGILQTDLPGGGDTMVWYGLFEMRAQDRYVRFGQWDDTNVVVGLDTSYILFDTIYTYELLRNDLGGVKVLPPYNYDCRISFSDIEYIAGQFWGIGDPDYPNRIYYSEYDSPGMNIFSWYPLDFVQIRELGNDELIVIELAEGFGDDALYLFAHNSIWLMNEEGSYQAISTRLGAASRETVVKHGDSVYFLSPDLRIHVLAGVQTNDISQGIENYVESVFVNWNKYGYQGFYAWAHTFGDYVRWFNDTTGMGLSFNTRSHVWTLERYGSGAYVPRGSFAYDTMRSGGASVIMTSDVELLHMDSTVSLRKAKPTAHSDVAGDRIERAIQFTYQTPGLGDDTRYQQIQEFEITLNVISPGAFHYTIYDEANDSLCGDSVPLIYTKETVHFRIHPPYNNCLRPSLKIYSNDADSLWYGGGDPYWQYYYHNFNVIDLNVKVRDMGAGNVQ